MIEAPYEVASDPRALAKGKYLYLDGKTYLRPILTPERFNEVATNIRQALNICDNTCTGLRRIWHKVTHNVGHNTINDIKQA